MRTIIIAILSLKNSTPPLMMKLALFLKLSSVTRLISASRLFPSTMALLYQRLSKNHKRLKLLPLKVTTRKSLLPRMRARSLNNWPIPNVVLITY